MEDTRDQSLPRRIWALKGVCPPHERASLTNVMMNSSQPRSSFSDPNNNFQGAIPFNTQGAIPSPTNHSPAHHSPTISSP
ncbi:hypothetical protein QYF36_017768 [Acer negundo]|nr:hypothetical protein QYF36_017768 [Acer negundo]